MDNSTIKQHLKDMRNQGIKESLYAPPIYQIAWSLGWHVTPPLIAGFWSNALLLGLLFGLPFGGFIAFQHADSHPPIVTFVLVAPISGLLFGLGCAAVYCYKARSLGL